jgi:protoporphyrin/coproporphyrin ferrochelatase
VLLINLGTPDAPEARAVRRYLAQFLTDPRVIEISPWLWRPVLHGAVLGFARRNRRMPTGRCGPTKDRRSPRSPNGRPKPSGAAGRGRRRRICDALRQSGNRERARANGEGRLRPHPGGAALSPILRCNHRERPGRSVRGARLRFDASRRFAPCPPIMTTRFTSMRWPEPRAPAQGARFRARAAALSFHGMPQRTLELGDPYHCHCQKTARLLGERLGSRPTSLSSRASDGPNGSSRRPTKCWPIIPSAGDTNRNRRAGLFGRLRRNSRGARHSRPRDLPRGRRRAIRPLDCLNDSAEGMHMLEGLVRRELAGWLQRE